MVEWFICYGGEKMINKVKKIIIFGGGTSGWLTAAYLTNNLQIPAEITLIEDKDLGPIGVGEGTQPLTASFLFECGIPPKMWMKKSQASFKYGVELTGWNDTPYFVDNDHSVNCVIAEDFFTSDYFISRDPEEFKKWHPAYRLAKENICQKFDDYLDVNPGMGPEGFGAVHFAAYEIIDTIKELIQDRIKYVNTNIERAEQDQYGITKLVGKDGTTYSADLFLDCSGFSSILLEKTLKVPFVPYDDWLPCDRAVVLPTQFNDPIKDCFPYTKATTMTSGWRFTIPIYTRTGNGYVYSSKFISDEDAEKELRESVGEFEAPAKFLKMKCGYHKEIAHKNVCAVGLSAGFVEPLEATGITFTTAVVKSIATLLNMTGNVWNSTCKDNINRGFYEMSIEILTFVWGHYHFSTRNDTPFWQNIRKQKISDMPEHVQYILSNFYPTPRPHLFFSPNSMFNVVQWFSMLHAGGAYKGHPNKLSKKQTQYAEYFLKSQDARVELARNMFSKQYDYLKEWYNEKD